jgi:molybdate transport system substrate-binding protein
MNTKSMHKEKVIVGSLRRTLFPILLAAASLSATIASAQDLTVMVSGAFAAPVEQLTPKFEASSGIRVILVHGASMGTSTDAIPMRLSRNETADIVIMARSGLDSLAQKGLVIDGSQVDLVKSRIGMVVRMGAPVPDISTVAAFKKALLAAKSIAISDSASGVYISSEMYKKLGIEDEVAPKTKRILDEPVAEVVARGDAEIGFQQISELKPVAGISIVGSIPDEVQKVTVFSAGVVASSQHKAAADAMIRFLASPVICPTIIENGLEPEACPPASPVAKP